MRRLDRSDVTDVVPMVRDCWDNLCNQDTVLGHLESLLALVLAPVVIPVLKLWLPQANPELLAAREKSRREWQDADL